MTSTTRRALYRVRNVARRLTQATAALRPVDWHELPLMARLALGGAERAASAVDDRLTKFLDDEPTAAVTWEIHTEPTP